MTNTACPSCAEVIDYNRHLTGTANQPIPGSISICATCGEVCRYTSEMALEVCDLDKLDMTPAKKAQIREIQARLQEHKREPLS